MRQAIRVGSVLAAVVASQALAGPGYDIGDSAIDFAAVSQDGVARTLHGDYIGNGNLTILDFCAAWCAPCASATPGIAPFVQEMADNGIGVNFLQLMVDGPVAGDDATLAHAQAWSSIYSNPHPVLTTATSGASPLRAQWEDYALAAGAGTVFPLYVFVDEAGTIFNRQVGTDDRLLRQTLYQRDSAVHGFAQPVESATVRWSIGADTATAAISPSYDVHHPMTSTGNVQTPHVLWTNYTADLHTLRLETWQFHFYDYDEANEQLHPIDTTQPITLEVLDLDWLDAVGGGDPGRDYDRVLHTGDALITLHGEDFATLWSGRIDLTFDGTRLATSFDPGELGLSGDTDLWQIEWSDITLRAVAVPEPALASALAAVPLFLRRRCPTRMA